MSDRFSTTLSLLLGILVIGCAVAATARAGEPGEAASEQDSRQVVAEAGGDHSHVADPVAAWLGETGGIETESAASSASSGDMPTGRFRLKRPDTGTHGRTMLPSGGTSALSLFWPLAIVLAVIVVLVIVLRKYLPGVSRLNGNGAINVLASHHLSNKQSLRLIRIGRRIVLVGVTPDRITSVAEITDVEEVAEVVATVEKNRPESFTSTLARLYAGRPGDETQDEEIESDVRVPSERLVAAGSNVRNLVDRIRGLSGEAASAEPA